MNNEQEKPAQAGQVERRVRPLPEPVPRHCCGDRLLPCKKCGADVWSFGEDEYGSLSDGGSYERFECGHCGNVIYVPIPD